MSTGGIDPKVIANLPAAVLKTIPAGQPPQGILADFANPPTRVPIVLAVSTVFLTLAVTCFTIRIYTKIAIAKNWRWDDCELHYPGSKGLNGINSNTH